MIEEIIAVWQLHAVSAIERETRTGKLLPAIIDERLGEVYADDLRIARARGQRLDERSGPAPDIENPAGGDARKIEELQRQTCAPPAHHPVVCDRVGEHLPGQTGTLPPTVTRCMSRRCCGHW